MENQTFYAIQATTEYGKLLCWREKKQFYFSVKTKGLRVPEPPTLFTSRKLAKQALSEIPEKGGNLKQFSSVIESKKTTIVKVTVVV